MVAIADLKSADESRGGSSPPSRTNYFARFDSGPGHHIEAHCSQNTEHPRRGLITLDYSSRLHIRRLSSVLHYGIMHPSSRGPGYRPFTASTPVRIRFWGAIYSTVAEWSNAAVCKTVKP